MFRSKTLFVIGAGAGVEIKMPTGAELKTTIAEKLSLRFDLGKVLEGDRLIAQAMRDYVEQEKLDNDELQAMVDAAWHIVDAMPQAMSIDHFIDAHRDNKALETAGKLAIVSSIIEAEGSSSLKFDEARPDRKMAFGNLLNSWLPPFFNVLTELLGRADVAKCFDNIGIINFNYDRCMEHYLFHALQNYYGIERTEAAEIVGTLSIYHPYGTVGELPWQARGARPTVPFGAERTKELATLSKGIRTFTQQVEEQKSVDIMHQRMVEAETVVFLGFAFHPQNMELINPHRRTETRRVFSTTRGISDSDLSIVEKRIKSVLRARNANHLQVNMKAGLTCVGLFGEYMRSLSYE